MNVVAGMITAQETWSHIVVKFHSVPKCCLLEHICHPPQLKVEQYLLVQVKLGWSF